MPWQTPPQSWEVITGTWGTDANRDELAASSGGYCVKMADTAVATKMRGSWIPVEINIAYTIMARVMTSAITAGYNFVVDIEEYGADKATLTNTFSLFAGGLTQTWGWEWVGGHFMPGGYGTHWIRVVISKTANTHFAYWDRVFVERWRPGFQAYMDFRFYIPTGVWTTFSYNTNEYGAVASEISGPASGIVTCEVPGFYAVSAAVEFEDPDYPCSFDIRLVHTVSGTPVYYYGTNQEEYGEFHTRLTVSNQHIYTPARNGAATFSVEVWQNSGQNCYTVASTATERYNHFSAHRVSGI